MHLNLTIYLPFNVSLRAWDSIRGNSFLCGNWMGLFLNVCRCVPTFDEWSAEINLPI